MKLLAFRFSGSLLAPIAVSLLQRRAGLSPALRSPLLFLESAEHDEETTSLRAWRRRVFALGAWLHEPSRLHLAIRRFVAEQGWLDLDGELMRRGQPTGLLAFLAECCCTMCICAERLQQFLANAKDDARCLEALLFIGVSQLVSPNFLC